MLTETALLWNGLTDPAVFREAFRFRHYDIETDDGTIESVASLQLPPLGLDTEIQEKDEKTLLIRVQSTLDQWIQQWNLWREKEVQKQAIQNRNRAYADLLTNSLQEDHRVNLDVLRNTLQFEASDIHREFTEKIEAIIPPTLPAMGFVPAKPLYAEPLIRFSDRMMFRKKGIIRRSEEDYARKVETWEKICEKIQLQYESQMNNYFEALKAREEEKQSVEREKAAARLAYEELRRQQNEAVDILHINYQGRQTDAVERYLELGLAQAAYPEGIPHNAELEYQRDNQTLFVAMELPHPDAVSTVKHPVVAAGTNPEPSTEQSPEAIADRYQDIVYKLILRHLHQLFAADEAQVVDAIGLNAWVRTLNRGNGQFENVCIATIFTTREDFEAINLSQVDPSLCFRFLKGISGPRLSDLTPIPTRFTISRKTREQVPTRKPLEPLLEEKNLANLSWKEFETLVLELFAMEFSQAGANLTLISSAPETGLEAISIDPDYLRGGTIVCMARRSHKPVALPAVRELYGTIMHEGAIKGVLATTSDFSPEVYAFAKNKPISLLNGTNLLSLFEKHGYKLRINLREAVSLEQWLS